MSVSTNATSPMACCCFLKFLQSSNQPFKAQTRHLPLKMDVTAHHLSFRIVLVETFDFSFFMWQTVGPATPNVARRKACLVKVKNKFSSLSQILHTYFLPPPTLLVGARGRKRQDPRPPFSTCLDLSLSTRTSPPDLLVHMEFQ